MKTLIAITVLILSTTVMAQQRVTPVTVTGGTIEIDNEAEPTQPIMCEDGMNDEQREDLTISRIRLFEEEQRNLQKKIDEMMHKRMSFYYDHIDVLE